MAKQQGEGPAPRRNIASLLDAGWRVVRGAVPAQARWPVLVLGGALAIALVLLATRPELAPRAPKERVWTVSAATVSFGDEQPAISLFGEIIAGRQVELRALVAGQVLATGPNFHNGGIVAKGERLIEIDPFNYQAAVDEAAAQLAGARARRVEIEAMLKSEADALAQEEEQLALSQRAFSRAETLGKKGTVSPKFIDDAKMALSRQRQAVIARRNARAVKAAQLTQQKATIKRLEVALRRARRDREKTTLRAPFAGYVRDVAANLGKQVGVNDRIATLIDADRLEARFSVTESQYGRLIAAKEPVIGRPVVITWRVGDEKLSFKARIARTGAQIDTASGGVTLFARLLGDEAPKELRPGAFVEISLPDRTYRAVARLPENALFHGDTVFAIVDERLQPRKVEPVAFLPGAVLVRGALKPGEKVLTTRFAEAGVGVKVAVR